MAAEDEARNKLNQRTKSQLIDMVLESGNAELEGRIAELEGQLQDAQEKLAEAEAAPAPADAPTTETSGKRFVQIATGQPIGAGLCLFALDEDGVIWGTVLGRKPWSPVPANGLPEFLS